MSDPTTLNIISHVHPKGKYVVTFGSAAANLTGWEIKTAIQRLLNVPDTSQVLKVRGRVFEDGDTGMNHGLSTDDTIHLEAISEASSPKYLPQQRPPATPPYPQRRPSSPPRYSAPPSHFPAQPPRRHPAGPAVITQQPRVQHRPGYNQSALVSVTPLRPASPPPVSPPPPPSQPVILASPPIKVAQPLAAPPSCAPSNPVCVSPVPAPAPACVPVAAAAPCNPCPPQSVVVAAPSPPPPATAVVSPVYAPAVVPVYTQPAPAVISEPPPRMGSPIAAQPSVVYPGSPIYRELCPTTPHPNDTLITPPVIEERPTPVDFEHVRVQKELLLRMKAEHDNLRLRRDAEFLEVHRSLQDLRTRSEVDISHLEREMQDRLDEISRLEMRQSHTAEALTRIHGERDMERSAEMQAARELGHRMAVLEEESERVRAAELELINRKVREQTDFQTMLDAERLRIEAQRRDKRLHAMDVETELQRRVEDLNIKEALLEREYSDIQARRSMIEHRV